LKPEINRPEEERVPAQVHGAVYAAGLMLMWACDLIVAADDVIFADVVGTRLGMCGVEYFAHPWEFGPRKAKELLLTGDSIDAEGGLTGSAWYRRFSR
jgi:enoyl-CoA hydratase